MPSLLFLTCISHAWCCVYSNMPRNLTLAKMTAKLTIFPANQVGPKNLTHNFCVYSLTLDVIGNISVHLYSPSAVQRRNFQHKRLALATMVHHLFRFTAQQINIRWKGSKKDTLHEFKHATGSCKSFFCFSQLCFWICEVIIPTGSKWGRIGVCLCVCVCPLARASV